MIAAIPSPTIHIAYKHEEHDAKWHMLRIEVCARIAWVLCVVVMCTHLSAMILSCVRHTQPYPLNDSEANGVCWLTFTTGLILYGAYIVVHICILLNAHAGLEPPDSCWPCRPCWPGGRRETIGFADYYWDYGRRILWYTYELTMAALAIADAAGALDAFPFLHGEVPFIVAYVAVIYVPPIALTLLALFTWGVVYTARCFAAVCCCFEATVVWDRKPAV